MCRESGSPTAPGTGSGRWPRSCGTGPNRLAQSLRTAAHVTRSALFPTSVATTPFAGQMILGAQEAAAEVGSLLLLLSSGGDADLEDRELQALVDRQVDGVVYASMFHRVVTPPAKLSDGPAVLLDARTESRGVQLCRA